MYTIVVWMCCGLTIFQPTLEVGIIGDPHHSRFTFPIFPFKMYKYQYNSAFVDITVHRSAISIPFEGIFETYVLWKIEARILRLFRLFLWYKNPVFPRILNFSGFFSWLHLIQCLELLKTKPKNMLRNVGGVASVNTYIQNRNFVWWKQYSHILAWKSFNFQT